MRGFGKLPAIPPSDEIRKILGAPATFDKAWPLIRAELKALDCDHPWQLMAAIATVQVECSRWVPCKERRASKTRQTKLWTLQERYWPKGFYGRGYLQHTWESNYRRLAWGLKLPLVRKPDLLLQPVIAAKAFAWQFVADGAAKAALDKNWTKVRRIINGPGMHHLDQFLKIIEALDLRA